MRLVWSLRTAWLLIHSARCMVGLRLRGARTGLVTCEGRLPVVIGDGTIRTGRLSLRAPRVPILIGAESAGELHIGDRTFLNEGVQIVAASLIRIGPDCRIGDFAAIHDSDHHPVEQSATTRHAPVTVGRNVWISRDAIVLPGVSIGDHAVIGAGAVVTADVPARTLVAGNPARVIRTLEAADEWRRT
jgi:acetyltransferase-like isoleucine patch superfamily enzyme